MNIKPTSFLVGEVFKKECVAWCHLKMGKPSDIRWKYYDDCGKTRIKFLDSKDALHFSIVMNGKYY